MSSTTAEQPRTSPETDAGDALTDARALGSQAITRTRSVAAAALTGARDGLGEAVSGARGGLKEAGRRLEDEERRWDAQAEAAALPDVHGKDPIDELAIRIDRESDYWRTFAVRSLRPGAARNLAIAGGVLTLASGVVLGAVSALAAAFGSAGTGQASLVTAASVASCAVVACALGAVSERGRIHAAHEALVRADHAERRLERVAAILALKHASPAKYVEALTRLERER